MFTKGPILYTLYYISKKWWPILYSTLPYNKMGRYFLDTDSTILGMYLCVWGS